MTWSPEDGSKAPSSLTTVVIPSGRDDSLGEGIEFNWKLALRRPPIGSVGGQKGWLPGENGEVILKAGQKWTFSKEGYRFYPMTHSIPLIQAGLAEAPTLAIVLIDRLEHITIENRIFTRGDYSISQVVE